MPSAYSVQEKTANRQFVIYAITPKATRAFGVNHTGEQSIHRTITLVQHKNKNKQLHHKPSIIILGLRMNGATCEHKDQIRTTREL